MKKIKSPKFPPFFLKTITLNSKSTKKVEKNMNEIVDVKYVCR
jgi:hypothetical protein